MGPSEHALVAMFRFDSIRTSQWVAWLERWKFPVPQMFMFPSDQDYWAFFQEVKRSVAEAGFLWTDLPYEKGGESKETAVYLTSLSEGKLLRGLLLVEWFVHTKGFTVAQVERLMGLEGGGQIAQSLSEDGTPLDRFQVSAQKIDLLLDYLKEHEALSVPLILSSLWNYLHLSSQEPRRYRMAYRFFGNREGIIPPLQETFSDLEGNLLDYLPDLDPKEQ